MRRTRSIWRVSGGVVGKVLCLLCMMGLVVVVGGGCYGLRPSRGAGQTTFERRVVSPADIAVPQGYRIEPVTTGLTFPTGITFDEENVPYVVEAGYSYGEAWATPRLLRINPDGTRITISEGGKNGPWTGVWFHEGVFYATEGGQLKGGRLVRIAPDGTITPLVEGLPGYGDHHANGPVVAPDGYLYFPVGTATNSAVVGEDNAQFGWLMRFPDFHDIPCLDIVLAGRNFTTPNPLTPDKDDEAATGAFVSFGTPTRPNQVIVGRIPCSGAILRVRPEGGRPELVAWGFRNPFGLALSPDGQLYATDNRYDDRGSRPLWGTPDLLWRVEPGAWYGWPDYSGDEPVDQERFKPPGKQVPSRVLAKDPGKPPKPVALLPVHGSADGFDFSRSPEFGHVGEAFIALFGDEAPTTGKVLGAVGIKVVRVNVDTGIIEDFAVNKGKVNGPASKLNTGGLERPVAARFDRTGRALYVVDFGVMLHDEEGAHPKEKTGMVWRITREPTVQAGTGGQQR